MEDAAINYYEHHIGDYDSATAHLSMAEDGAYNRLIRLYYRTEGALPADIKQVWRLVRAQTKADRETVRTLLEEFFELRDDGWHNARCDEEVARFQDKQAKASASANARWNGPKVGRNKNANALRTHTDETCDRNANASLEHMRTACETDAPRARPNHQAPITNQKHSSARQDSQTLEPENPQPPSESQLARATANGLCARTLRSAGHECSGNTPAVDAYVQAGGTPEHLAEVAAYDRCRGKNGAYVATTALAELTSPTNPGTTHANGSRTSKPNPQQRVRDAIESRKQRERIIEHGPVGD